MVLFLSGALAACREPTAPEARDYVRDAQQKLATGDIRGLEEVIWTLGRAAGVVTNEFGHSNDALSVRRDGSLETINGFVVEEILIPPPAFGKAVVRRTLVGWPNDLDYLLYATAEENRAVPSGDLEPNRSRLRPLAQLSVNRRNRDASWVAVDGLIDIGPGVSEESCEVAARRFPETENVTCRLAMFEVEVHGLFVRRADVEQRVAQPFRSHHRFEVARTRVPGVRFTTKCAEPGLTSDGEDPEEGTEDCGFFPAMYWRDQSMFPFLAGVDWLAMERSRSDERLEAFVKRNGGFIPGSADSIRVRVYRADGTLVRDAIEGFTPPWKSPVTAWSNGVARTLYSTSPASLDLQPGEASIGLQRSSAFPGLKLSWYEPLIVLTERGSGR